MQNVCTHSYIALKTKKYRKCLQSLIIYLLGNWKYFNIFCTEIILSTVLVNNAKKLKIINCIGYDITIAADAEPQNKSSFFFFF